MNKANSRRMKRRLVPTGSTPKCASYLMQQHRDNERDRHRELNEAINEVVCRVPGYQTFAKHSKIVRLQRVIDYITHLERNIEAIYNQMNVSYDFRNQFLSANLAWPSAVSCWGSKQSSLSNGTRTRGRSSTRCYQQIVAEVTAEHSTRAASRCGTEELAEDVDDDDDNEASALVIDETDREQYQLVDAVSTGCCTPLKNAVAAEQPALVSGTDDSVDGAAEKSQFWIVVKRHLSPVASGTHEQACSNTAANVHVRSSSDYTKLLGHAPKIVLQAVKRKEGCEPQVLVIQPATSGSEHCGEEVATHGPL